jgi:hypothetical protein
VARFNLGAWAGVSLGVVGCVAEEQPPLLHPVATTWRDGEVAYRLDQPLRHPSSVEPTISSLCHHGPYQILSAVDDNDETRGAAVTMGYTTVVRTRKRHAIWVTFRCGQAE